MNIGFIGGGNMGEAMIGALIQSNIYKPSEIFVSDINRERIDMLGRTYSINITSDNDELFTLCDIIILAIKPQVMEQILSDLTSHSSYGKGSNRKLIISIAAGTPITKIERILYEPLDSQAEKLMPIVRVMPNTPALVLSGMSGMCKNSNTEDKDVAVAVNILESMGKVIECSESDIDAVTAVSGSGPAYVFYFIESILEAAIKQGLGPEEATTLTIETFKGAVKLLEERDETPGQLRRNVTSPGGTTEAALKVFKGMNVKNIIIDAIAAAADRSRELSK